MTSRQSTIYDTRSSSGVSSPDDRSYRSYLTFDARPETVALGLQQIEGWLREKGYGEVDLGASGFLRLNENVELVIAHHQSRYAEAFRVRLTETDNKGEQWVTSIAMFSPIKDDGWLSIRVLHTGGKAAETPKVARYLIGVLDLRDSGYQFVAGAPIIRPEGVDDLLDAVCDPDRNGLLFVAATDTSDPTMFAPFAAKVEKWARRVHGLAQVVVLDPAATEAFNQGIGRTHNAPPWTIRTYSTGVDPAWSSDARRHRILGTERLARDHDNVIAGILVNAARSHASTHRLPEAARPVIKDLNRVEDRLLVESLFENEPAAAPTVEAEVEAVDVEATMPAEGAAPSQTVQGEQAGPGVVEDTEVFPDADTADAEDTGTVPDVAAAKRPDTAADPTGDVSEYLAVVEMVKQTLGLETLTQEAIQQVMQEARRATEQAKARLETTDRISRELAERQTRIEQLEDDLSVARIAVDDALVEQRIADDARLRAQDEALAVRRRLDELGQHEAAWQELDHEEVTKIPESFEDLIDQLPNLKAHGIVFTGNSDITLGLDAQDTAGNIVSVAWECLLVIKDYIAAKSAGAYQGNMKQYLLNTPSGYRTVTTKRFGEKEASSTLDQWADDRVFPVPGEVDRDEQVLMEAHFKLPHCGTVTPRIHYYDHTHATGKIYVGYIGPHLRTKGTN